MHEFEEWLQQARQALSLSQDPEAARQHADNVITRLSDGRFKTIAELESFVAPFERIQDPQRRTFAIQSAVEAQEEAKKAEALAELGGGDFADPASQGRRRLGAGIRNVAEHLSQLFSFNLADEALEAVGLEEAGETQRRRQNLRQEFAPGASLATEAAGVLGSVVLPGAVLGRNFPARGFGARQGAIVGTARGATAGGTGAALSQFGLSDPGSEGRSPSSVAAAAGFGALVGGGFGLVTGGLMGALSRKFRSRRTRERLTEGTGLPDMGLEDVRKADIDEIRETVQRKAYRPLQEANREVTDEGIIRVIDGIQDNERLDVLPDEIKRIGPREITSIGFGRAATGARRVGGRRRRPPSFEELQQVRRDLFDMGLSPKLRLEEPERARSALRFAQALDAAMEARFGAQFAEANAVWRRAARNEAALDAGWDLWDGKFDDVRRHLREIHATIPDDIPDREKLVAEATSFFNRGRLANWRAELGRGDAARRKFFNLMEEDDRRASMATMFPGGERGEAFQTFVRDMRRAGWQENTRKLLDRLLIASGVAVGAGVVGGAVGSRLGGNQGGR